MKLHRALCLICLLLALLTSSPLAAQGREDGGAQDLGQALRRGDWELAERLATSHDDAPALLARAQLAWMRGQLSDAARYGEAAATRATDATQRQDGVWWQARVERATGKRAEAEARLRAALKAAPRHAKTRLELGELLLEQGKRSEAKLILDTFSVQFNDGQMKTAPDLVCVARSMALLGSFDDANFALKQALKADPSDADTHVAWGELLIEKYNIADARESFEDALKHNPKHPGALIGLAQAELLTSNQTSGARNLLELAEAISPREPKLLITRAHLAIMADLDCKTGLQLAERVLADRPQQLEALTVQGICAYISDDPARFDQIKAAVLAIHPYYSDFFSYVGEYAVRVFRYEPSLDLYKEAIKLNGQDSRALLGMGTSLSRVGREDEAKEYLKRAFDADPYNVRAYNMLELYEKVIPEYSFREYKRFKLRTHKSQRDLLEQLIPPLVDRALDAFAKKYSYDIHKDLALEIYPDPQAFSVRIAGLPSISPQGVCFGKVVMSRSPSDGNFNWAQVIWHELAHVYHIQLSDYHVARWFTEGLAEYETNVFDPAWSRHYDRELASQVFLDAIPSVTQFDHGFTQSSTLLGVVRAYHLASLAIHFIAETWGFDKLPAMLRAWGDHKTQEQVFKDVLGVTYAQFDQRFLAWLKQRYMNFANQLMVDADDLPSLPTLEKALVRSNNNPRLWAQLALLQQAAGQQEPSEAALKRALELAPADPTIQTYAVTHRMRLGRMRDAVEHGAKVLAAGKDSYELRLNLGMAQLALEDTKYARVHLEAAVAQYDDGVDAWVQLLWLGKNTADDALYALALERLYLLNQNDPFVPKLRGELAIKQGKWDVVRESGERWVDINPFDVESHRMVIAAAAKRKDGARAEAAWRALITLRPEERDALIQQARAFFTSIGDTTRAAQFSPQ